MRAWIGKRFGLTAKDLRTSVLRNALAMAFQFSLLGILTLLTGSSAFLLASIGISLAWVIGYRWGIMDGQRVIDDALDPELKAALNALKDEALETALDAQGDEALEKLRKTAPYN